MYLHYFLQRRRNQGCSVKTIDLNSLLPRRRMTRFAIPWVISVNANLEGKAKCEQQLTFESVAYSSKSGVKTLDCAQMMTEVVARVKLHSIPGEHHLPRLLPHGVLQGHHHRGLLPCCAQTKPGASSSSIVRPKCVWDDHQIPKQPPIPLPHIPRESPSDAIKDTAPLPVPEIAPPFSHFSLTPPASPHHANALAVPAAKTSTAPNPRWSSPACFTHTPTVSRAWTHP